MLGFASTSVSTRLLSNMAAILSSGCPTNGMPVIYIERMDGYQSTTAYNSVLSIVDLVLVWANLQKEVMGGLLLAGRFCRVCRQCILPKYLIIFIAATNLAYLCFSFINTSFKSQYVFRNIFHFDVVFGDY